MEKKSSEDLHWVIGKIKYHMFFFHMWNLCVYTYIIDIHMHTHTHDIIVGELFMRKKGTSEVRERGWKRTQGMGRWVGHEK